MMIFAWIILLEVFPYAFLCQLANEKLVVPFLVAQAIVNNRDIEIPKIGEEFAAEKSLPIHGFNESSALNWKVLYRIH